MDENIWWRKNLMDSGPPREAGGGNHLIGGKHLGDPEGERFNWMKTFRGGKDLGGQPSPGGRRGKI